MNKGNGSHGSLMVSTFWWLDSQLGRVRMNE